MRGSERIYVVRMANLVQKYFKKLFHIIGARGSQHLRFPSMIMAPASKEFAS